MSKAARAAARAAVRQEANGSAQIPHARTPQEQASSVTIPLAPCADVGSRRTKVEEASLQPTIGSARTQNARTLMDGVSSLRTRIAPYASFQLQRGQVRPPRQKIIGYVPTSPVKIAPIPASLLQKSRVHCAARQKQKEEKYSWPQMTVGVALTSRVRTRVG